MAVEDFTTYTEVDPNSHISVTAGKCESVALARNEDAYVYKDRGVDHFNGDFEFLFTWRTKTSGDTGGNAALAVLTNEVDDYTGWTHGIFAFAQGHPTYAIYVVSIDGGWSSAYACADNTVRYCTLGRSGTTVTLKIYTDSARTNLDATLTTTDSGSYRYIYGMASNNSGHTDNVTGIYIEDFDLQEVAVVPRSLGLIIG